MLPQQVLLQQIPVDLGVVAMKKYSTSPKAAKMEPYHQMKFSVIYRRPLLQGMQSAYSKPRPQSILVVEFGLVGRVITNGLGDWGSILGQVIPKTQKMVLDTSLLNTQHYKVQIKGKVRQSGKGLAPFLTPQCSSY